MQWMAVPQQIEQRLLRQSRQRTSTPGPIRQGNGCRPATFAAESTLVEAEDPLPRGPERYAVEIGVAT